MPAPAPAFRVLARHDGLKYPRDVDVGPDGRLYVVDRTATVHVYERDGVHVRSFPMPDRGRGNPQGLSVAHDGRILVADTYNHRLREVDPAKGTIRTVYGRGTGELYEPGGVAVLDKAAYVADTNHHRIVRIDLRSGRARALEIVVPAAAEASP